MLLLSNSSHQLRSHGMAWLDTLTTTKLACFDTLSRPGITLAPCNHHLLHDLYYCPHFAPHHPDASHALHASPTPHLSLTPCCSTLPAAHPFAAAAVAPLLLLLLLLLLFLVATMEVKLPKDYICRCQCGVKLVVTYPTETCSYQGPYPMVMFTSGFQVGGQLPGSFDGDQNSLPSHLCCRQCAWLPAFPA
jgi:hypothetical protein